jgi:hypothetical protein
VFGVDRNLGLGEPQEVCALNAVCVVRELVRRVIIDIHSLRALPRKSGVICSILQIFGPFQLICAQPC